MSTQDHLHNDHLYPGNLIEFKKLIEKLKKNHTIQNSHEKISCCILPDVNFVYSNVASIKIYETLKLQKPKTIILIGSYDLNNKEEIIISDDKPWKTLFGEIAIDQKMLEKFIKKLEMQNINYRKAISDSEWQKLRSQVQLLAYFLPSHTIVPILFNNTENYKLFAKIINSIFDHETVLLVSCNLPCINQDSESNKNEINITDSILSLNTEKILKNIPKCSALDNLGKVLLAMEFANKKNLTAERLCFLRNSDNINDSKVNYLTFIFHKRNSKILLEIIKKTLDNYVGMDSQKRKIFEEELNNKSAPEIYPNILHESRAIFINLYTNDALRGCAGCIKPECNLQQTLMKYLICAGFHDNRFFPLTSEELKEIKIEISILSPLRKISSIDEIEFKKHGIIIEDENGAQGIFLPEISEHFECLEDFIKELCMQKLGREQDFYLTNHAKIFVFTTEKLLYEFSE